MKITRRSFIAGSVLGAAGAALAGCGPAQEKKNNQEKPERDRNKYSGLTLKKDAWHYDSINDVYYQLGITYCLSPQAPSYEKLNIYIPGAYMVAQKSGGDTYTCTPTATRTIGSYNGFSAPIVMPINCAHFSPQTPQGVYSYEGLASYLGAGCIYVFAGCRGAASGYDATNNGNGYYAGGIPSMVSDLKAAIRYLKYNKALLAGNVDNIAVMGVGAVGFLATLLGASGAYDHYSSSLDEIGAALWDADGNDIIDNPSVVGAWTPQVSLPTQDASYEWLYGQYITSDSRKQGSWTHALSRDLASSFATRLNAYNLADAEGSALKLEETANTVYSAGSFYSDALNQVQQAARAFFASTTFPLVIDAPAQKEAPFPGDVTSASEDELEQNAQQNSAANAANAYGQESQQTPFAPEQYGSFKSAQAYSRALNQKGNWLSYAPATSSVTVSSLADYTRYCAGASLACTPYDSVACNTPDNSLFGTKDASALHYSRMIADLINANMNRYTSLAGWSDAYVLAWEKDLEREDEAHNTVLERVKLTDQFAFVTGEQHATLARRWRINAGLAQSAIPWTSALLLSRMLSRAEGVAESVFNPIWAQGVSLAESTSDGPAQFLAWLARDVPNQTYHEEMQDRG